MEQPVFPPTEYHSFPIFDLLRNGVICRQSVRLGAIGHYRWACENQNKRLRAGWASPNSAKSEEALWLHAGRRFIREAARQKAAFDALPVETKIAVITADGEINNGVLPAAERNDRILQIMGKNPYRDALYAFSARADRLTAKREAWRAYAVACYFCRGMRDALCA